MLYPVLKVLMMPVAAVLFDTLGVARLLLVQSALSLLSALIENKITVAETPRGGERFSLRLWWGDLREAAAYLKREKGLRALYDYMAVTNGMAAGYSPLLIAFFRTAPGFTAWMLMALPVCLPAFSASGRTNFTSASCPQVNSTETEMALPPIFAS